jgi:hypothetical protein
MPKSILAMLTKYYILEGNSGKLYNNEQGGIVFFGVPQDITLQRSQISPLVRCIHRSANSQFYEPT